MVTDEPGEESRLLEALHRKRRNRPWNESMICDLAGEPRALKSRATHCANCEAPCDRDEVCATVVAHESGLLDRVGRDQAFAHVESGFRRLRLRGEAAVRDEGGDRPNRFVALSERPDR